LDPNARGGEADAIGVPPQQAEENYTRTTRIAGRAGAKDFSGHNDFLPLCGVVDDRTFDAAGHHRYRAQSS